MAELASSPNGISAVSVPSVARRYYVTILLTLVYAFNFLDRTIFNVLIEPIKKEFVLSDTVMGLIAGFGFVLFYSLLGIPIARLADRVNRISIISAALAFWSLMTICCGLAQNAVMLALARIGVGIGESASTPASQSIVSDLFAKDDRPRAMGILAVGTSIGVFLGYFFGAWVNQHYGWRIAFITAGLPGILLALIVWLTVSEPQRGLMDGPNAVVREPLKQTAAFLAGQQTFIIVLIGFCLTGYTNYATGAWIPSFLARVHHLTSAEIGTYAGTFKGIFGMAGTLAGGFIVTKIGRSDDRWKLWAPAIASALAGPVFAACLFASDFAMMIALMGAASFLFGFHLGPIFAIVNTIARPGMRAFAAAVILLVGTCFGQGLGPLLVGVGNDALRAAYGNEAIRYSLLSPALTSMLGAAFFVWASASIRPDIAKASASTA